MQKYYHLSKLNSSSPPKRKEEGDGGARGLLCPEGQSSWRNMQKARNKNSVCQTERETLVGDKPRRMQMQVGILG